MPINGKLDVESRADSLPLLSGFDTDAWELPGTEILLLSFEVSEGPAEGLIPPALHPSIPPYALLSVARYPHSPVGPFCLAQVRLVARAGGRPRGYLLGAYTDSESAADELRTRWGFHVGLGACSLEARHDRVLGRVTCEERTILELGLENPELIAGEDVTNPDSLHLIRAIRAHERGVEKPLLIQVDPEYVFHHAQRGRPHLISMQTEAWDGDQRLACTYPIAASYVRCDTDLPRLRFGLDPSVPDARGRIRLAERSG